ncbi:hypothetical protein ES703_11084 [subsurface metagenome]
MIEQIFEMICQEARSRKGQSLEIDMMMVLFEITEKVTNTILSLKVDRIKSTRLKFRRKDP